MLSVFGNNFMDDYELKNKIGEGTFSDVWLCVQRTTGKELAAKILKTDYQKTLDAATWNSVNEVNVASSVKNHPFLLLMKAAYHEPTTRKVILVSELMKRSLFDIIENKCVLTYYQIKTYMFQILEGLKYLHENGFIHRDIKPENILLTSHDRVLKIGDFGSTCSVAVGQPYTEYVATRWYRSPECILTQGWYCTKMDIWASGCVLYEIATGQPLFDGENEMNQLEKIDLMLGSPDQGLIDKFKKHKSEIFIKRYEMSEQSDRIAKGAGLHSVYQPYQPPYDLLKDMIVYDPVKRFSSDRLLRKAYFYEMKNSEHKYKLREFKESLSKKIPTKSLSSEDKKYSTNKKQGPGGDRILNLKNGIKQDENISHCIDMNRAPDNTDQDSQKQNTHKVCSIYNLRKHLNLQKSVNNIYSKNEKPNPELNVHLRNNFPEKKKLTTSVSTLKKVSTTKLKENSLKNRLPFK